MPENQTCEKLRKRIQELEKALSEQKRINEKLHEDLSRFQLLYERVSLGYQSLDEQGHFLEVNQAWLDLLGYTREEVIGRSFSEFLHSDWKKHFEENFPRFKAIGEITGVEFEMIKKDGKSILVTFNGKIGRKIDGSFQQTHCILHEITEQKRAEDALRASEEHYRTILESSPILFVIHRKGVIDYINRAGCAILGGKDPSEMKGRNIFDLVHPEYKNKVARRFANLKAGHINAPEDIGIVRDDGEILFLQNTSLPVQFRNETAVLLMSVDITERKRVEKALRESERKWRNILVSTPQIGISFDPQARIVFANEHLLKLTGWKRREIIGRDWFEMFIPEYIREEVRKVFQTTISQKDALDFSNYENEILTRSGDLLNIAWSNVVNKDSEGNVSEITCLGVDLTERRKAENEIRKQKRLFETMFNTIPDGVVITNTRREIQLANKGVETTFGYRPEDLLGKSTEMLYANQSKYREAGSAVFDKNAKKPGDLYITRYRKKSGQEFTGETFGAKLLDENNQWIGNLGIMRDITEREQAEMRVQQAQKMESIGNLAGGIAHDFNNILFPIIGIAELLLEDLPKDSQEYENAQEILRAGKRGSDLVNQILAFSRQSAHQLIPVRAQQILREVLKLMRATIPSYIEIHEDIQSDCGLMMANPTQIHQVAMNIITNAFHAMESDGGKITVKLKEVTLESGELPGSFLESGRYAVLSISDSGHGMSADLLTKIFEPYFTTKEQGKGTGLGLAVAYGIVKEHKGEIKVYSELGKGTTFNIYLPVMSRPSGMESHDATEVNHSGHERILVVDDEAAIAKLEKQMLERLGYKVTSRVNSLEAVEVFKARPDDFDVVVTDMTMPHLTGDQLVRELRMIRPDIPVIICTGFSERINAGKAEKIGIQGFLMKPILKAELSRIVRKVLDEARRSVQG